MSTILKLKQWNTLNTNLNKLVVLFNEIKLNETAASYVNGMPVTDIDPATILRQHKYDKASTLPYFTEYQNAGIDLSASMADCAETAACLQSLIDLRDKGLSVQFGNEIKFIAYDKSISQFTVTSAGKEALNDAIVTLKGKEEEAFKAIYALHELLTSIDSRIAKKVFSENVINTGFNTDLRADDVVYYITTFTKPN